MENETVRMRRPVTEHEREKNKQKIHHPVISAEMTWE